ncbi:MAG: C4-dicarboxylate TRAP transporter substrate-binding protein [Lawsonibacter sp.]|nr:C4-dicarboxylate TRAP transporter substrate-binding protein [Lawsonibacter sp.]
MKKLLALAMAVAMSMSLAACGGSTASSTPAAGSSTASSSTSSAAATPDKVYELKVSTTQAETAPIVQGLQSIADKVAKDTNGGVKITIYPSSQLGVEEDMIDQALQGMNIAVLTDAARMSNYVYDMGIFNMAYLVDNYDEACKVMATDTFKGWEDELTQQGLRVLCFNFYDGARSFMTNKPVTTPDDLKGMVIRTPGADPWVNSIESMGATAYAVAWSEVYNSIQTKVIDGCEVQYTSAVSTHINEVCKYIDKTEHINLINCLITGETWFQTLPAEYQETLLKDAYDCAYENAKYVESLQPEMEKTLVDNGMEIVEVDKAAFKEAAKAAYDKMGWTELRQEIYKEIGKQG